MHRIMKAVTVKRHSPDKPEMSKNAGGLLQKSYTADHTLKGFNKKQITGRVLKCRKIMNPEFAFNSLMPFAHLIGRV